MSKRIISCLSPSQKLSDIRLTTLKEPQATARPFLFSIDHMELKNEVEPLPEPELLESGLWTVPSLMMAISCSVATAPSESVSVIKIV